LAFSFIFATAMQQAFENIIFLYSVRSYMTGDTLLYNGQFLTVQEISINYTCFMSDLNQQFWIATTEIRRTPFVNLSNSGNKWEIINILVDADSDPEVLKLIQGIVANLHKDNPKEYGPGQRARYNKAVDPFKFNIQVLFEYSHNGLDLFRTAMARSYVMEKISEVLRTKSVSYTLPSIRPDALAQQQDETETDLQVQATQNRDVFTRLANVAPF
jgi:small-conductance mechanosensitive channel